MAETNEPLAFKAALARGLVSRRGFVAGLGGLGVAGALAGCGVKGRNPGARSGAAATPTAKAAEDKSAAEKVVNWSNWPEYIDVDDKTQKRPTLDAFTKKYGIKVNYTEDYNDNDEFYAKVRPLLAAGNDTGRDVWCSTDWMVARLIRQGYAQRLDLPLPLIGPAAQAALEAYSWPGNTRELENSVHFALLVSEGDEVGRGQRLAEWDPYTLPIIAEKGGIAKYVDLDLGLTVREETDDATGISRRIVSDWRSAPKGNELRPAITIVDAEGNTVRLDNGNPAHYFMSVDAILSVAYRVFPDSKAAKGGRTPAEEPTSESVAFAHILRGVHW